MKKEIAEQWVAILRSGMVEQATGRLEDTAGSMCCLGVLSAMAEAEGICRRREVHNHGYSYDTAETVLPPAVVVWAEVSSNDGGRGHNRKTLTRLNDNGGLSFSEIADIIEKEWESL